MIRVRLGGSAYVCLMAPGINSLTGLGYLTAACCHRLAATYTMYLGSLGYTARVVSFNEVTFMYLYGTIPTSTYHAHSLAQQLLLLQIYR